MSLDNDLDLDLSMEFDRDVTGDGLGESYIEFNDGDVHERGLINFDVDSLSEPSADMWYFPSSSDICILM